MVLVLAKKQHILLQEDLCCSFGKISNLSIIFIFPVLTVKDTISFRIVLDPKITL